MGGAVKHKATLPPLPSPNLTPKLGPNGGDMLAEKNMGSSHSHRDCLGVPRCGAAAGSLGAAGGGAGAARGAARGAAGTHIHQAPAKQRQGSF